MSFCVRTPIGVFTALVPSRLGTTELLLVSCHRATGWCSTCTMFSFPTKIIGTASPKSLVAHKVQKVPSRHWFFDPGGYRLYVLGSAHTR